MVILRANTQELLTLVGVVVVVATFFNTIFMDNAYGYNIYFELEYSVRPHQIVMYFFLFFGCSFPHVWYGQSYLILNNVVTKIISGGSSCSCDTTTLFIVFSITRTIKTFISSCFFMWVLRI